MERKENQASSLSMRGGSSVDATIIDAPSLTKNASGRRDPETRQTRKGALHPVERAIERRRASVRSHVEHVFRTVKGVFGYRKCRYRGLRKNGCRLNVLLAGHNPLLVARAGRTAQFLGA